MPAWEAMMSAEVENDACVRPLGPELLAHQGEQRRIGQLVRKLHAANTGDGTALQQGHPALWPFLAVIAWLKPAGTPEIDFRIGNSHCDNGGKACDDRHLQEHRSRRELPRDETRQNCGCDIAGTRPGGVASQAGGQHLTRA